MLLGAEVDALDPRADAVSLLTLHAAKGLEFPVVFLVGCDDRMLPLRFGGPAAEIDEEELDEERRLLFVGLTRAQRRLFLSHPRRRTRGATEFTVDRSPFLNGLDEFLTITRAAAKPHGSASRQLRLL